MLEAFVDGDEIKLEKVGDAWKVSLLVAGGGFVTPGLGPNYKTPEEALAAMANTAKDIKR